MHAALCCKLKTLLQIIRPAVSCFSNNCLDAILSSVEHADVRARQVYYNVPYEDMHAPAVGMPAPL